MTSSGRHAPCTDRNGSGDKSSSISKCSVGMSGGHFTGILTLLTCRGSKGAHNVQWTLALCGPEQSGDVPSGKFRNSPKAGSGAEWLATLRNLPVIFPPLNRHPPSHIFPPTLSDQNGDDGGFVVQGQTVEEIEKLPFR